MVLIDATPLQSEHRLRGVGAYLRELVRALEALGEIRPHYLISTAGLDHVKGILPPERLVTVPRPHSPAQVYWLYNEAVVRFALRRARPGVFFAPDFNGLLKNPFGKTVAVLHDLTALKLAAASGPKDLSLWLSDLRWRAYYQKLKGADQVIAISHSAKRDAVTLLGLPERRIKVVHHGVDHGRFPVSTGQGRYAGHPPYFVNLGGRNDNKNQARILEAFATLNRDHPDVHLYFAGPWRAPDLAWLEASCERLGLQGRARHVGYVEQDALPSLFGNAVAFLFPSLEEGFGLPVLEAMASGAPVITSNRSSLPEVAGDAAILVDPLAVEEMASAMTCLLNEPDRGEAYRVKGFRQAAAFTWRRTAQETVKLLKEAP